MKSLTRAVAGIAALALLATTVSFVQAQGAKKRLAYVTRNSGKFQVAVLDLATKQVQVITDSQKVRVFIRRATTATWFGHMLGIDFVPITVKAAAQANGFQASFMAKPYPDGLGSGQHVHVSLTDRAGRNVFDNGSVEGSELLRYAAGGLVTQAIYTGDKSVRLGFFELNLKF